MEPREAPPRKRFKNHHSPVMFSNLVCSNFIYHQSAHPSPVVHGPLVHATQGYHTMPIVHATTEYHAAQSVHTYAVIDDYSKAAFDAATADGAGSVSGSYSVALPDVTYEGTAVFPEVSQVVKADDNFYIEPVLNSEMSLSVIDPHKLQTQRTQHYSALKFGSRTSVTQPLAQHDDSISYPIDQESDTPTSPVQTNSYYICQTKFDTTFMYLIAVIICQILFSKLKKLHACNEGALNHPLLILLTSLVLYDYCISSTFLCTDYHHTGTNFIPENNDYDDFDMDSLNYIGHKLHHLDLSTTKLTNLPTAWLCSSIPSLTTFNMSHNSVTHLMDQDLWFVPNIEQLNLAGNLLTTLPTCVFAHLASLLALDLSDNTISSIPGNVLDGTPALQKLFLQNNSLSEVSHQLLSNLQILNLQHNNLSEILAKQFSPLIHLHILMISLNQIKTVKQFP